MLDAITDLLGDHLPMHRIGIIATYFGNWPIWFPAFLRSCETNDTIKWLIYTDCPPLSNAPSNVKFMPETMTGLNRRASKALGLEVCKNLYSQCDLRPAYGLIFAEDLAAFDWWGHCDLDVIWGDLGAVLTDAVLAGADIVSSPQGPYSPRARQSVAGHLTIWRNTETVNRLYRSFPGFAEKLSSPEHFVFDETDVSVYVRRPDCQVRMAWLDRQVIDYHDLERRPYGWTWTDGKLHDADGQEWHYLHFMTWKRYLKRIDFQVGDSPRSFVIQRRGIWSKGIPRHEAILNRLGLDYWLNRALRVKRSVGRFAGHVAGESWRRWALKRKRRRW